MKAKYTLNGSLIVLLLLLGGMAMANARIPLEGRVKIDFEDIVHEENDIKSVIGVSDNHLFFVVGGGENNEDVLTQAIIVDDGKAEIEAITGASKIRFLTRGSATHLFFVVDGGDDDKDTLKQAIIMDDGVVEVEDVVKRDNIKTIARLADNRLVFVISGRFTETLELLTIMGDGEIETEKVATSRTINDLTRLSDTRLAFKMGGYTIDSLDLLSIMDNGEVEVERVSNSSPELILGLSDKHLVFFTSNLLTENLHLATIKDNGKIKVKRVDLSANETLRPGNIKVDTFRRLSAERVTFSVNYFTWGDFLADLYHGEHDRYDTELRLLTIDEGEAKIRLLDNSYNQSWDASAKLDYPKAVPTIRLSDDSMIFYRGGFPYPHWRHLCLATFMGDGSILAWRFLPDLSLEDIADAVVLSDTRLIIKQEGELELLEILE